MSSPYRIDQVGSLLRPPSLLRARADHEAGRLDDDGLRTAEDAAILDVLELQYDAGVDVVTDGEFRRDSFMSDFPQRVEGFSELPVQADWKGADGQDTESRAQPMIVSGKLRQRCRLADEQAAFLAVHARRPYKVTLPSPALYVNASYQPGITDRVYPDHAALRADVVGIIRGEVEALAAEGVPYIQLDNPHYATLIDDGGREQLRAKGIDPDTALADVIASDNACLEAVDRTDRVMGLHVCRGNNRSRWMREGAYDRIAEQAFAELEFDALLLEYDDERSGGFEALRFVRDGVTVVLGLVTSKTPELERPDDLLRRVEEAARYVPVERLALSPQCGFASVKEGNLLTLDDQRRKLELVARVADRVWGGASIASMAPSENRD